MRYTDAAVMYNQPSGTETTVHGAVRRFPVSVWENHVCNANAHLKLRYDDITSKINRIR